MPQISVPEPIQQQIDALVRCYARLPAPHPRILRYSDELLHQVRQDLDELVAAVKLDVPALADQLQVLQTLVREAATMVDNRRNPGRGAQSEAAFAELAQQRNLMLSLCDFGLGHLPEVASILSDIRDGDSREDTIQDALRLADLMEAHQELLRGRVSPELLATIHLDRPVVLAQKLDESVQQDQQEARELFELRNELLTLLIQTADDLQAAGRFAFRRADRLPAAYRRGVLSRAKESHSQ